MSFDGNRFYGVFELAGHNVPKTDMKMMQRIIKELKPNDSKLDSFKYKRVFRTKWYDLKDVEDIVNETEKAVRSAVNELLDMEKTLIDRLNLNKE